MRSQRAMSTAESAAATMPVREESSVGRNARCQTRSTKKGSSPTTSGARSASMVATRASGDAAVFHASPTPRWPESASTKTSTITFSCHRVRGFHTRPPMSRRTIRGMTLVIFMPGRVDQGPRPDNRGRRCRRLASRGRRRPSPLAAERCGR